MLTFFDRSPAGFINKILVMLLYIGASLSIAQRSHHLVLDSAQSRIDVDAKGSVPATPLQPGNSDLTMVKQGEMEWNVTDTFIPVWEKEAGEEFDHSLEVFPQKDSTTWPAGGLIFTGDVENGSGVFSLVTLTPKSGVVFNARDASGSGNKLAGSPAVTLPVWIRLAKTGSVVTGYYKPTSKAQWVSLGSLDYGSYKPANPAVGKALFKPGSEL